MKEKAQPTISEDEEFIYIPEELFELLPPEYREAVEARRQQGIEAIAIVDKDIQNLIRLAKAFPTTVSLRYILSRLRTAKFEATMEAVLEQEMLTTAFVVTYARLFISGSGGSGVARDQIPSHLQAVHDDLIEIRHKRYAHNAGHSSIESGIQVDFDDQQFNVSLQLKLGSYIGGRNEWEELTAFLDAHMHDRVYKILARMKEKTGYEWTFPTGPAPDWTRADEDRR